MRRVKNSRGFTLVEMLMVLGILSVVAGAVYSLYLVHLRTAYTQDEVVEVQQNLRIAMASICKDLDMAGMLVPLSATPSPTLANGYGNYSTSLVINTVSPEGRLTRITHNSLTAPYTNFTTTVDSPPGAAGFSNGDRVRLVKPYDNSPEFANLSTLTVSSAPGSSSGIALQIPGGGSFPSGVQINAGDVIAKINTPSVNSYPARLAKPYNSILYTLVNNAGNSNCPVGWCLARQVNPAVPPPQASADEIIASNLSHLSFSYLMDSGLETSNPSGSEGSVKAVRISLTGTTTKRIGPTWVPRSRQLTNLVKLRNRRQY
jgi:prepilin-type N-terminal cleavage/methylation domain-containing protein